MQVNVGALSWKHRTSWSLRSFYLNLRQEIFWTRKKVTNGIFILQSLRKRTKQNFMISWWRCRDWRATQHLMASSWDFFRSTWFLVNRKCQKKGQMNFIYHFHSQSSTRIKYPGTYFLILIVSFFLCSRQFIYLSSSMENHKKQSLRRVTFKCLSF